MLMVNIHSFKFTAVRNCNRNGVYNLSIFVIGKHIIISRWLALIYLGYLSDQTYCQQLRFDIAQLKPRSVDFWHATHN